MNSKISKMDNDKKQFDHQKVLEALRSHFDESNKENAGSQYLRNLNISELVKVKDWLD